MNMMIWLDESFSLRLAQTLLHFLWQGCAIGFVVIVVGRLLQRTSSHVRYSLNVAALLVLVSCVPVTFLLSNVNFPNFSWRAFRVR